MGSSIRSERIALASGATLAGDLVVPSDAVGVVVFAHGSGSSRLSPRNRAVARALNERRLATVLVDLLSADEEARDRVTREHRFDIAMLAVRVGEVVDWVVGPAGVAGLPVGLFGASTGAAAALVAAAGPGGPVRALVSRGGRPDLAGDALARVVVPTLLLVGGRDRDVLALNQRAAALLAGPVELRVVPGASHLFEEPGALEQVQHHAAGWFLDHLPGSPPDR